MAPVEQLTKSFVLKEDIGVLGFVGMAKGSWGGGEEGGQDTTLVPEGFANNKIKFHGGCVPRIFDYMFQFTSWLYTTM